MKIRTILCLIPILSLSACVSPKYNYAPVAVSLSEPPIGSVNTSQVGDVMLRQGKYKEHDAIYLQNQVDAGWAYTLYPGFYLKHGEDESAEYYYPSGGEDSGRVDKAALADNWKSIMAKKEERVLCIITVFNVAACGDESSIEKRRKPVLTQDSFQQTLIYNGRVGNKINVGYREFSNSLARPAFNNNVEYDYSESKIIGYKGAQLEVIEATNQYIKYKVFRNFNDASF